MWLLPQGFQPLGMVERLGGPLGIFLGEAGLVNEQCGLAVAATLTRRAAGQVPDRGRGTGAGGPADQHLGAVATGCRGPTMGVPREAVEADICF